MTTRDVPVTLAGTRWLDIERQWPLWTAARQRQAAIAILDQAVRSLPDGARLVAEILGAVPVAPRSILPLMEFTAQQRRLLRDLQAVAARPGVRRDARLHQRAATAIEELLRLMEQVADLQVSLQISPVDEASRRLSHLLLDMSRLVADAWTCARSGAALDLQLRGLARAHAQASRVGGQVTSATDDARQRAAQLAAKAIVRRQTRAISLMNGPLLIILVAPRRALDELITRPWDAADTIADIRADRKSQGSMPATRFNAKDSEVLTLFARAGVNVRRTAELLDQLLTEWPESEGLRAEILECEHAGDRITHDLIHALHLAPPRTFDREDLFALAAALDDIVDFAEEVADYLGLYQIEAPMEAAQQLAVVLHEATGTLANALNRLHDIDTLKPLLVDIHRLENEGDRIVRGAIASLFVGGIDPTVIIRWKDLFERLEDAIDSCEKAAHILEGIVIKQG